MEEAGRRKRGIPPNLVRICVDDSDADLKGRMFIRISRKKIEFQNCDEMFLKTDQLFDQCGFPQTFQEKRGFRSQQESGNFAMPEMYMDDEVLLEQKGKQATFDVLVQSRRRAGWQGWILTEDGSGKYSFRGEIGLLQYIWNHLGVLQKNI